VNILAKLAFLGCLLAACEVQAQAPVIGQGGAAPGPALVQRGNHVFGGGPTPKFSGCGGTGATIVGTDTAGRVLLGSAWMTASDFCFIQFAVAYPSPPMCHAIAEAGNSLQPSTTISFSNDATSIVVTSGGVANTYIVWHCIGINPP
jgi:hypothetical protein